MSKPKSTQKDPVKKLCVRLSVSKERSRNVPDMAKRERLVTASGLQVHPRRPKARRCLSADREGSMIVNPPSTDHLSQIKPQSSLFEPPQDGSHHRRSSSCRRCEQKQPSEKDLQKNETRKTLNPIDSKGLYHYPKRMQTGPGECTPPTPNSNEMARVKEWINQWCHLYDKGEVEVTDEQHRHKHKVHHRRRVCSQPDSCGVSCGLRRCPQYLDLATDHLTYPYHTESQSFGFANASLRPHHHHRHNEHHHCKRNCSRDNDMCNHDGQQPVVHRHEHHHHHSHHHYHHYVS